MQNVQNENYNVKTHFPDFVIPVYSGLLDYSAELLQRQEGKESAMKPILEIP